MGIIAACIPTLRHGWKWLHGKIAQWNSRSGHAQLDDEVQLRPYDKVGPMKGVVITSGHEGYNGDMDSSRIPPTFPQIHKTTRVDIDLEEGP